MVSNNDIELILNSLLFSASNNNNDEEGEEEIIKLLSNSIIKSSLNLIFLQQIELNNNNYNNKEEEEKDNNKKIRFLSFKLINKLSLIKNGLNDLNLLLLFSTLFNKDNSILVKQIIQRIIDFNDLNLNNLINTTLITFTSNSNTSNTSNTSNSNQQLYNHLNLIPLSELRLKFNLAFSLTRSNLIISSLYGKSNKIISLLLHLYDVTLPNLRPPTTSTSQNTIGKDNTEFNQWLSFRLEILEIFHSLLESTYLTPLSLHPPPPERILLFESLESLLLSPLEELTRKLKSKSPSSNSSPLMDLPLLMDLEYYFRLGEKLGKSNGMRRSSLIELFEGLGEKNSRLIGEDGLGLLRKFVTRRRATPAPQSSNIKGKGKALSLPTSTFSVLSPSSSSPDAEALNLSISQILSIFPNNTYSTSFLKSCLVHPSFNGSTEEVISALLENNLPPDLMGLGVDREGEGVIQEGEEAEKKVVPISFKSERRNVFEGEKMDINRIKRGKEINKTADTLLSDRSFMTDSLKATIIERAERESSDEEDEDEDEDESKEIHTEAFLEDFEDGNKRDGFGVRDAGDVEDGEGDNEREETVVAPVIPPHNPLANPITPTISNLLELQYLTDPTIFDRSSSTRKSKERIALRERTGLADEQLEGWKVMLDRNPRKEKILSKHAFSGNKSTTNESSDTLIPPITSGSNRGGRGGNRGGERGSRGKSDGGRAAHDRRQRGNDRKMAKVA